MSTIDTTTRVIGPVLADCPDDGGKWAIYCEHVDHTGDVVYTGIAQDTNRRRLSAWRASTPDWCVACQTTRDDLDRAVAS